MSLHKEIELEDEICEHLSRNGWLYNQGDSELFDRGLALFPKDLQDWVEDEVMRLTGTELAGGWSVAPSAKRYDRDVLLMLPSAATAPPTQAAG